MGTNTAELTAKVIENAYQVLSIHFIALAQATDCLNLRGRLAPATAAAYDAIRSIVVPIVEDRTYYEDLANVHYYLRENIK